MASGVAWQPETRGTARLLRLWRPPQPAIPPDSGPVSRTEGNLSEGMRWLQATWAARFNRLRGEAGRPFQGRYKALHVESGHALAQVAHYIHLNPVRAGSPNDSTWVPPLMSASM